MLVLAGGTKVIPTLLNQEFKFQKLSSKTYRHSEKPVYEEVLILLQKDAEMIGKLGEPLKKGKVFRAQIIPQNSLKADTLVEFEVIGASKKARVYVEARVDTGVVFLKKLILYFDNPYEKIWKLSRLTEQKTA